MYSDTVQIMDYFHAKEYLYQFANEYFQCSDELEKWIKEQCDYLLDVKVEQVLKVLKKMHVKNQ